MITKFMKPIYQTPHIFSYKLSSGNYGILLSNNSKIIVSQDLFQFYYLRRSMIDGKSRFKASLHNFGEVPKCLKSKFQSISIALSALSDNKFPQESQINNKPENEDVAFYLSQNIVY